MRTLSKRLARRKKRVSANIRGTATLPRVAIHRSNKFIYAQVIDDTERKTLASANTVALEASTKQKKTESAKACGIILAKTLKDNHIEKVVIDRGRFRYFGRVLALVEGLREGGITV